MTMLNTIMSAVMNNAMRRPSTSTTDDDRLGKENRAALRKLFENAGPKERQALLPEMEKAGIETGPYRAMEGIVTPEEQTDQLMSQEFLRILTGQVPSQPATSQTPAAPATTQTPSTPATAEPTQPQVRPEIFSRDFLTRAAIKKYSGIDVGAHYFDAPQWFEHYGQLVQSGTPVEQAVSDTAVKFGFIPDGASNLEGLSDTDRSVLFEREFSQALSDPTLDSIIREIVPKGTNLEKAKAGLILDAFAQQGRYISEHYQPFLDRFRGLEDPAFVGDDKLTWIYQNKGKMLAEITPSDVADADKALRDQDIVDATRRAYNETDARLNAEFDNEIKKPVSGEDKAKYGVTSKFPTYTELADAGYRFPSAAEQDLYSNYYSIRAQMLDMEEALFGSKADPASGIFTGVGTNLGNRISAKAALQYDRVKGTLRGQNLSYYEGVLASMARTLLKMANSGSSERPTDIDIRQIMRSAPDVSGVPDSEDVARRKYDRYLMLLGKQLERLQSFTTLGLSEGGGQTPSTDQYEIGDVYEFDDGTIRTYTGKDEKGVDQWEIQNQPEE